MASAPTIWATILPMNEIQAERTFSRFFFCLFSPSGSTGDGLTGVTTPAVAIRTSLVPS